MPEALLVEDDPTARRALTELVERRGFSTSAAEDVDAARQLLTSQRFDVVLLDVYLPSGSGIDLLLELPRDRRPQAVLMSGDDSVRSAFSSLPLGQLHFLKKPIQAKDLAEILQQVRRRCRSDEREAEQAAARLVGASPEIERLRRLLAKVAPTDLAVYIEGESGTGKELIAQAIHAASPRHKGPFVAINCGALPETLIDSELFGHEKGAFTGAETTREGVFERANGGTLFLDEITEMPVELQTRLLRTLENRTVRRVGGSRDRDVDVRIVSATNRPFDKAIADGALREDLFHRLCVFPIVSPPLRERGGDVLLLANTFLREFAGRDIRLSEKAAAIVSSYGWPGNVRQLRNAMQHGAVMAEGDTMSADDLPAHVLSAAGVKAGEGRSDERPAAVPASSAAAPPVSSSAPTAAATPAPPAASPAGEGIALPVGTSIADAERRLIEATLERFDGDKKSTAEVLGVSLRTLYNRLSQYERGEDAAEE